MRYRLMPREGTCTFQRIARGRKTVGRVCPHGDGGFLGVINTGGGRETFRAATAVDAFEGVVARRLGYESAADLKQRNVVVRRDNKIRNAEMRARLAPVREAIASRDVPGFARELDKLMGFKEEDKQ